MNVIEKRKKVFLFLAKYCFYVLDDLNKFKERKTNTIANFDVSDFRDGVNNIISAVDNYEGEFVTFNGREYICFDIEYEASGWTYKHNYRNPKWLKKYIKENTLNVQCIAYEKMFCLFISKDYEFLFSYRYEIYNGEMEEDFLIKRWYSAVKYKKLPTFKLGEVLCIFQNSGVGR